MNPLIFGIFLNLCLGKEGILKPLDTIKRGQAAGNVSYFDVKNWLDVLPKTKGKRSPADSQNRILADAITLATICNLYRDDKSALGHNRSTKYIFVTSDRSIANAVKKRLAILKSNGIPDFIRPPLDFMPLINLQAMNNSLGKVPSSGAISKSFR